MRLYSILFCILFLFSCQTKIKNQVDPEAILLDEIANQWKVYTEESNSLNEYMGFDSPKAINKIAAMENEYFNSFEDSVSRYYGTIWKQSAESILTNDSTTYFDQYQNEISQRNESSDSMHCTIYAMEALKAGFGDDFEELVRHHKRIWKDREFAGWSIAHILTTYFDWQAILVVSPESHEYKACLKNYKKDGTYHVWKQPNIKVAALLDFNSDKSRINEMLKSNEFGWGFSDQGWHTWFTRYDVLKECNWAGAPGSVFQYSAAPLFMKTAFTSYLDYASHIIVFPPKK